MGSRVIVIGSSSNKSLKAEALGADIKEAAAQTGLWCGENFGKITLDIP